MYTFCLEKIPKTIMFGRVKQISGWEHTGRTSPEHILVLVIDGSADFCIQEKRIHLIKNNALFIIKGTYFTANTTDFCEYYFFHFLSDIVFTNSSLSIDPVYPLLRKSFQLYSFDLSEPDFDCSVSETAIVYEPCYERLIQSITYCQNYNIQFNKENRMCFELEFSKILTILATCSSGHAQNDSPRLIRQSTKYIHTFYRTSLSLADISEYFHVSKSYLEKMFKVHVGESVNSYINHLKLDHAVELLENSNMNISEIAQYLGYSSVYYFSRIFKVRYGMSPLHYLSR